MEDVKRYRGRVVKLGQNYAFIDKATVVTLDGEVFLATEHDIYVHKCEFVGDAFAVGMDLSFQVMIDDRRKKKNALRAVKVRYAGVELHFPERVIDHPSVPVNWCFKPAVLDYIRSKPKHAFALVVGAVIPDAPSSTKVLEMDIGLDALRDGASFVTFYAPGDYEVYVYLVEYYCSERGARNAWFGVKIDTQRYCPKLHEEIAVEGRYDLPFLELKHNEGKVVAISTLTLSVPDGIFADKQLTGWKLNWFLYFWDKDLVDDCDRRGKKIFAFSIGFLVYALWEFLKRGYFFFWGLFSFFVGNKPSFAWKETFSSNLSADIDEVRYAENEPLMEYQGWNELTRPWIVLLLLCCIGVMVWLPDIAIALSGLAGLVALGMLAVYIWRRYFRKTEEQVFAKKFELMEASLACGAQPAKKPVSVRLLWSGIKRRFCRSYSQA